jgi:hypothetical protein
MKLLRARIRARLLSPWAGMALSVLTVVLILQLGLASTASAVTLCAGMLFGWLIRGRW